jgi:Protein of unknown function (DUF2750)
MTDQQPPIDPARLSTYQNALVTQAGAETSEQVIARFVQGAVLTRQVWVVAGVDGIASVPSPTAPGCATFLVWSHHTEAARWADVLIAEPQVLSLTVASFLAETLPAIAAVNGLLGTDWSTDPIEAEAQPVAIAADMRAELVRDFATVALKTRSVWLLQDAGEIATVETVDGAGPVVPIWADRASAEAIAAVVGLTTQRLPLVEITNRFLLSAAGLKVRMAPGYVHSPNAVSLSAWGFKALLTGSSKSSARVA